MSESTGPCRREAPVPPAPSSRPSSTVATMLTGQVHALRRRTQRRQFPSAVDVYRTDADQDRPECVLDGETEALDHALRVELLAGALDRLITTWTINASESPRVPVFVRIIRPDPCEPLDEDHAWWRALQAASGVVATPGGLVIDAHTVYAVTRSGWLDVNAPPPVLAPRS